MGHAEEHGVSRVELEVTGRSGKSQAVRSIQGGHPNTSPLFADSELTNGSSPRRPCHFTNAEKLTQRVSPTREGVNSGCVFRLGRRHH